MPMRCALFLLAALAAVQTAFAQSPEFIASQVTSSDYSNHLSSLPVQQGKSRGFYDADPVHGYSAQPDLLTARSNIINTFSSILGPTNVSEQAVNLDQFPGQNIIGVLHGTDPTAGIYVVGAHYDAITGGFVNQPVSPGADDNASGVAGVMTAANILSRYHFKATIYFVAFDLEESRFGNSPHWHTRGSYVYAQQAQAAGMNIRGMISLDMIAAHRNSTETNVDVSDAIAGSGGMGVEVADALDRVGSALGTGLTAQRFGAQDVSDHIEFKAVGYKACMVAEANEGENPYYHSNNDYLGNTENGHPYIDSIYASKIVAGAVDYLATAAVVVPEPTQVVLMAGVSTNGLFTLAFQGDAGRAYEIDASTNLANWDFVTNLLSGDGNFQFTDGQSKLLSQRFFRVLAR